MEIKQKIENLQVSEEILGQLFICGECNVSFHYHEDFMEHVHEKRCQDNTILRTDVQTQCSEAIYHTLKKSLC